MPARFCGRLFVELVMTARLLTLVSVAALIAAACRRAPEPPAGGPTPAAPKASAPLPPEMQKIQDRLDALADRTRMEVAQSEKDRAELVTPAPAGFKPKVQGRQLELKLILQKAMIRKGERFWYRAEIRNVGSEPVTIRDPFIKSADSGDPRFKFKLVFMPSRPFEGLGLGLGAECDAGIKIPGWDKMDERQREEALAREQLAEEIDRHVAILVKSGETLRTRDQRVVEPEEYCNSKVPDRLLDRPGGLFREYPSTWELERPGTYLIKLVLDDQPIPFSDERRASLRRRGISDAAIERHIRALSDSHLGFAESETVRIEVVP